MTNVETRILKLVKKMFHDPRVDFTLDTSLDLLDLDSLSYTEFIIECEDEFSIEIDLDDPKVREWTTLRHLSDEISRLLN
jgi:acyl carrier protein